MSDAAVIELNDVYKRYGQRLALGGVSLRIEPGVTGLLGPNGSGKSTLIKSLMGLVATESGDGHVLGHPWPRSARAIRDLVGYLPEDDCYVAGLQGVESVQLGGRLSGLPRLEALRRAHEVMDFCDIGQERYRQVETYSTGMRQKLKFAQALVHDPPLIILDEPTTGLDPGQREALLNRIGVLAKKFGKTILLSTHILPDVRQVCDAVVILVAGRVRLSASLESMSRPATPELNLWVEEGVERLEARVQAEGIATTRRPPYELRIVGLEPEDAPRVWGWANEVGAAIRKLEPARASLEQTFVDAVREAAASGELEPRALESSKLAAAEVSHADH
ncbi:ABC transporter ATP-binding protein [Candidatus Laterigemmans baculatus]|uniref:ABC transporter ATP-binding protein n=1 Tax=Candidatus Laterigemmans baculatus TaxID=2770505 RepID=UPI0013DC5E23|nr:ABC transporter ATP-binding protein [Candidatus Laterigemmans baculatus]